MEQSLVNEQYELYKKRKAELQAEDEAYKAEQEKARIRRAEYNAKLPKKAGTVTVGKKHECCVCHNTFPRGTIMGFRSFKVGFGWEEGFHYVSEYTCPDCMEATKA